jgi:hypothetical protein
VKKTEPEPIELNNHEKMLIRKLARMIKRGETTKAKQIEQEDKEDAPFRRKIVK